MNLAASLEDAEPVLTCIELDWLGHGRTLLIKVGKTLDISDHSAFRRAYASSSADISEYIVDFSATRWIDPSVLGMLLLLRKHAGGDRRHIHITGAGYRIRDALAGANIHALFTTDTLLPPVAVSAGKVGHNVA